MYRSHFQDAKLHCTFVKSLEQSLNKINRKECFLCDDCKFNVLHPYEPNTSNFIDAMFEFGFIPLISKLARISHCSATLLDHTWANSSMHHKLHTAIVTNCLSDHLPVMMCLPYPKFKYCL